MSEIERIEAILQEDELLYEFVVKLIRSMPQTMLPALMLEIVEVGYQKPVFQPPDGASRLVSRKEQKLRT